MNRDPRFALSQELEANGQLPPRRERAQLHRRRCPLRRHEPAGLISCAVRVWQYSHEQWFPITGVARWDEFAPIKTVWVDNQPTQRKVLDKSGRWGDMPFLMLAKCAEAQAIRKGWPEDLSNTFVGKLLGHANATTTARYAHLDADPLRRASERIGSTIAAAMGDGTVPGTAKIIRLRE